MIGKVLRGNDARRLLYYLYGPGRANEHTDPHLVAGFSDPADLEPERRRDGSRDFRRLAGLLAQPLAALAGPGYDKPVWHCAVRAAPQDRMLSDAEWAQVAAQVMGTTGLAPQVDELGVRWVAVRHAADHVHLVATLARQDGGRPRIWNDFYRVRQACQDAEQRLGLTGTAPADRTAARRATRAENEQAARRGWAESPRVTLHREVCTAAAGAGSEQEFFARLRQAGVLVRHRHSTVSPAEVTGYAVGLPGHTARNGQLIWYGGGKLAADLTLPKLRARWPGPATPGAVSGTGLSPAAARAVLRSTVESASAQALDEAGFFAQLRAVGVLVRLRFSEADPGQVTGYSVTLPAHADTGGAPVWYSGGRLASSLTMPQLRRRWGHGRPGVPERSGAPGFTAPERAAIYAHAADRAAAASRAHPPLRWHRPGGRSGRCLGCSRLPAHRGAGAAEPGAALCCRCLRPCRPCTARAPAAPHRRRRPAACQCPAAGHARWQHGGRDARLFRAGCQPGCADGHRRRTAPGPAARRAGRRRPRRGPASSRRHDWHPACLALPASSHAPASADRAVGYRT